VQLKSGLAMTRPDEATRFTWVRCPGCGNGLWRRYAGHIEMPLTLRGGQKRTISAPIAGMGLLKVTCEKCGGMWTGDSQATLQREDEA
jgi:ribosomal protein S27E